MNNQTPGENISQNNQLTQRKQIEGTPFYLIKQILDRPISNGKDQERYFIVMGDYRLTEPTDNEYDTIEKLKTEHWNIVCNIIAITTEKMIKEQLTEALNLIENLTDKDKQTILTYI